MSARGPLERIRDDELDWPDLGAPLKGLVQHDLAGLDGPDDDLRRAADVISRGDPGRGDDGITGLIAEMTWQLGDLDGVLDGTGLADADRGLRAFGADLEDRDDTVTT